MLLGALGLLLGERGSTDLLRSGAEELRITGRFELTAPDDSSPLELGSDEVPKLPAGSGDEEVTLGELTGAGAGASGINIQDPGDIE